MRIAKTSTKRVLGLALAAALSVGATVAGSTTSEAASTAAAKVAPATGGGTSGGVLTVTGKGFKVGSVVKALSVTFETAACPTTVGATAGTALSVLSATELTVKIPTLSTSTTGTKYYVCVNNAASSTTTVLGQGSYTAYTAPTITYLNGTIVTGAVIAKTSVFGGSTITLDGTNFTKSAKINVDGVAIPTTFVDSTTLTGVLPAHTATTGLVISVTDLYGTVKAATPANATVTYVNAIKVSPSTGTGAVVDPIKIVGSGFNALTFVSTGVGTAGVNIFFIKGGQSVAAAVDLTTPAPVACTNINVVSDTVLTCTAPVVGTLAKGTYTVAILEIDSGDIIQSNTANTDHNSGAVFTRADF
jgi:hypothetical protein